MRWAALVPFTHAAFAAHKPNTMNNSNQTESNGTNPSPQYTTSSTGAVPVIEGVSKATVSAAGLQCVDPSTALRSCGIQQSGLLIPYFDIHGLPIMDAGGPFSRLRLDKPIAETGQKYHQRAGTKAHAYVPPGTAERISTQKPLVVIEGEKKALCLADAGSCIPIGLGGFYSFKNTDGSLVPELDAVLAGNNLPIVFFGDRDVLFNKQFSHAACAFAKLVGQHRLYVGCVSPNAPGKGVDDCRHILGEKFAPWFTQELEQVVEVEASVTPVKLAVKLLTKKLAAEPATDHAMKERLAEGFPKLLAAFGNDAPLESKEMLDLAMTCTGIGRADLKRAVKEARKKFMRKLHLENGADPLSSIDLSQQTGVWTTQCLERLRMETYFHANALCQFTGKCFEPFDAKRLAPFVDVPERCSFFRPDKEGSPVKTSLDETNAKLIWGQSQNKKDLLRSVEVLSFVPVLAKTPTGITIVSGYCPETKIFVPDGANMESLPSVQAAIVMLFHLLREFRPASKGDILRMIAFLITPALAHGGFLGHGRAPLFLIEKDKEGTGGGTLVRLVAALYRLAPRSISPQDPKAAREDISKALVEGGSLIYLDNIRGDLLQNLGFFESLLTEPIFACRYPYGQGTANVERRVFAVTSNGATLSRDLASRTVSVKLLAQPTGYVFKHSLDELVAENGLKYLAAIYSIIHAWWDSGCKDGTQMSGFRFREWEGICTWIVESCIPLRCPLLGSEYEQVKARLADPTVDVLRQIFREACQREGSRRHTASSLLTFAIEKGIYPNDEEPHLLKLGKILTTHFPEDGSHEFAGEYAVTRTSEKAKDSNWKQMKFYTIAPIDKVSKM